MSLIKFTPIDPLIESLKVSGKFSDNDKTRLWQSLKSLSDAINQVNQLSIVTTTLTIETPKGVIDGVNKTFTLINKPNGLVIGFKNSLLLLNKIDYNMNDNRILFTVAPALNVILQWIYQY